MFIRFVLPLSISYHDQYILILSSLHLLLHIYCYPCASCYCYTCISVSHYPLSSLCISRYLVDAYISVLCSSLSSFTDAWPIYIHCPSLLYCFLYAYPTFMSVFIVSYMHMPTILLPMCLFYFHAYCCWLLHADTPRMPTILLYGWWANKHCFDNKDSSTDYLALYREFLYPLWGKHR